MKLGLVGVGRWGKTLARKFKEIGHEIAFYDRLRSGDEEEGLGQRVGWTEMKNWVDAMVVAATPPITSDIALVCAMSGVPVLATKPLLNVSEIVVKRKPAPFAVDYVHLHSPIMKMLYDMTDGMKKRRVYIEKVTAEFWGKGPVRTLNSIYDFGPHAISSVLELTTSRTIDVDSASVKQVDDRELWTVAGRADEVEVTLVVGNGADDERSRLDVTMSDGTLVRYDESYPRAYLEVSGKTVQRTEAHDPLRALLEEFADHVNNRGGQMAEAAAQADLSMSVDVEEAISKIRRAVAGGP